MMSSIHPGEVVLEDVIKGFGITADTAMRLARYFGTSAEFWLSLQAHYELRTQGRNLAAHLDRIEPLLERIWSRSDAVTERVRTPWPA